MRFGRNNVFSCEYIFSSLANMTFANKITICRIIIVPFFIATVLYYSPEFDFLRLVALGLFLFAVISDVIDGYIARTRNQKTIAGAILDPLADKFLLISAFTCLYFKPEIASPFLPLPIWFVVAVISRDIILLIGAMIIFLVRGVFNVEPTKWGRATAFFQISSVFSVFLHWNFSLYIWIVTLILTLISLVDYTIKGIEIINNES
ncbi:MAG: CDP-alcohol phosphatidyltransferase family protein [Candidatus Omnitrophica bacterium]|nr:CDP-alcohol phosphatidyltransferase family protein [Candidatus Omnitrophota bacterium]MBU1997288.1 CDP-alcohol phosphatidyltransferase family protein [Candidatus Omnitrophota bacterium]MBU4333155.1 CDP-alcohol phosphatidyltransferase family protein [Candidatus Omnitrophota bacterium]